MDTRAIKVRRIGNSLGVILSREMLGALGVSEGDDLFAVRTLEGLRLTPYDPNFAAAIQSGRRYMRRYRNAMRELARR
jgi:putative addiction module antidote